MEQNLQTHMTKFCDMLHGCVMHKRKVANTHKQNSTTNATDCKYEYHCEACDSTYDIFKCGRCDLDMTVCVCEDPELNHISRHVAKMCRNCFNDISMYDPNFCELITGLKQLPELLIFLRMVLSKLLSKPTNVADLSRTERCKKSWSAFVEYMRKCNPHMNDIDEEEEDALLKKARDALPVSSGIKCFLFGQHLPSVCQYKPWERRGQCDDDKPTNKHITQGDALLSPEQALEKCSFKQMRPRSSRSNKTTTLFAKRNSVVEVLDPDTSTWVLGTVKEALKDELCYHIQYVEPHRMEREQNVECGRVRLLTLGKYVAMVMRDFGFSSRSSVTKPELAQFLDNAFNTDDFDPTCFLGQLHEHSNPCCLAVMMAAIATGFDIENNGNKTSHLWDKHSGPLDSSIMRLNYDHLENRETIRAIDMLSLWYGLLFLVPTFSSDVMSQFMHEPLLRVVRGEKDLATPCGKKTTAWSGVPHEITHDPLSFIDAFKNRDNEGILIVPTDYINLGMTDLPFTHMMSIFNQGDFLTELHTITRYHSSRFTMTCTGKKRRCGSGLKRLLVLLQSTETNPGDTIDTCQLEIRKIKSRFSTIYNLMECFHDEKPVPQNLLRDTIKNLLDLNASQFKERVDAMPLMQQTRRDAKARLGDKSTVLNIRKRRGDYQTNIFNRIAEHSKHSEPADVVSIEKVEVDDVDHSDGNMSECGELTETDFNEILGCGADDGDGNLGFDGDFGDVHSKPSPSGNELTHDNQLDDIANQLSLDDVPSNFVPKKIPVLPARPVYDNSMLDADALRLAQQMESAEEEGSLDLNRHAQIAKLQQEAVAEKKRKDANERLKQKNAQAQQTATASSFFDSSSDESSSDEEDEDEGEAMSETTTTKRKAVQVEDTDQSDKSNKDETLPVLVQTRAKRNKVDKSPTHKRKSDEAAKTNEPTKKTKSAKPRNKKTKKTKKTKKQSQTTHDDIQYFFQFMRNCST